MFYSAENQKQVDELSSFFSDEQYRQIHERMQQRGFRNGFACLFYGGPGTGKTETVYQLARKTGRDIMIVDVPKIKSKWVGDSEKNIKALFDHYRELVSRAGDEKPAPILLFNEADAIIGVRKEGAQSAVDKMENSIQNIILQEMETLDGIMIATTNLVDNLDNAFERRFLYKIKFDKPDAAVRSKIWQTMIPELTETESAALADSYELSGGQIENVARKHAINSILHGDTKDLLPVLRNYCNNERLCTKRELRRVGF
jgi:SpoVK/Ycf46/Vps4 family AAA+-type ATPase